jgi:hypothetical protein
MLRRLAWSAAVKIVGRRRTTEDLVEIPPEEALSRAAALQRQVNLLNRREQDARGSVRTAPARLFIAGNCSSAGLAGKNEAAQIQTRLQRLGLAFLRTGL